MKNLPIILFAGVVLFVNLAGGYDCPSSSEPRDVPSGFLQPDEWWNFYFSDRNDPLKRSVRAVKIVQLSERHSSWVQLTFPEDRDEHFSIFGPAAKAHDDRAIDLDAALAKWEMGITEWKTMWINLDFVVHATKVKQSDEREPE